MLLFQVACVPSSTHMIPTPTTIFLPSIETDLPKKTAFGSGLASFCASPQALSPPYCAQICKWSLHTCALTTTVSPSMAIDSPK